MAGIGETVGKLQPKAKAESSPGVGDVVAEIEQQAKTQTAGELAAYQARTPKSERGSPLLNDIARAERREERAKAQAVGTPDAVKLRLSAQTQGEFTSMLCSLNMSPASLGDITVEQTHAARAVLRIVNKVERDDAMRKFLLELKRELDGGAK